MPPTWCGPMPRTPRFWTTLRNRHERQLCRMPTPARCAHLANLGADPTPVSPGGRWRWPDGE
jgi:hypothetical protein